MGGTILALNRLKIKKRIYQNCYLLSVNGACYAKRTSHETQSKCFKLTTQNLALSTQKKKISPTNALFNNTDNQNKIGPVSSENIYTKISLNTKSFLTMTISKLIGPEKINTCNWGRHKCKCHQMKMRLT